MKPRNNTPVLLAVVGVALLGMGFLNRLQYESRPRSSAELQAEQAEQEAKLKAGQGAPSSAPTPAPTGADDDLLTLEPEESFGTPVKEAERHVVLGYSWTPGIQAEPARFLESLKSFQSMLERMNGSMQLKASFQFVNVDVVRDKEPGIWVDGHYLGLLDLETLRSGSSHQVQSIMREIRSTFPPGKKSSSVKS
jgi:hypothetical protein